MRRVGVSDLVPDLVPWKLSSRLRAIVDYQHDRELGDRWPPESSLLLPAIRTCVKLRRRPGGRSRHMGMADQCHAK